MMNSKQRKQNKQMVFASFRAKALSTRELKRLHKKIKEDK